ncbi:aminotransferase class I/II-fold pyridoxal phosphate-dependent enzyme [Weissella kandleri]|uniref:aminotransferase class I/II-fold pyridoxal phosphate-dependent enzyme n=1 Tax=Weissella kandleri TaxID=1616 RepID=UPI00387E8D6F
MTKDFIQPINQTVKAMTIDGLTGFQKKLSGLDDLVYLTFGEPGFNVDDRVKQTMIQAIEDDHSHYAVAEGDLALRQAAVDYYDRKFDLHFHGPENVIVTSGVTESIYALFQTLLTPGDGVLIPTPSYPPYFAAINIIGGKMLKLDTTSNHFKLTPEAVEKALAETDLKVKVVLFNYPSNPTGVTYTEDELKALAEVFKKHQIWVISDEIYAELTYDVKHMSMMNLLPDQTVLITGLSKSHAMTGYRIGFVMGSEAIINEVGKVHDTLTFALPQVTQDGARAAVTIAADAPDQMRPIYQRRRDYAMQRMSDMGFDVGNPQGAFYIFAKIPEDFSAGTDGLQFAWDLAVEGGVGVAPGIAFSDATAEYIRICYAGDDEALAVAMDRMAAWIEKKRAERA